MAGLHFWGMAKLSQSTLRYNRRLFNIDRPESPTTDLGSVRAAVPDPFQAGVEADRPAEILTFSIAHSPWPKNLVGDIPNEPFSTIQPGRRSL